MVAPWIGMTRGFWRDPERYLDAYWRWWRLHVEIDGAHDMDARNWAADMQRQNEVWLASDRILRFTAFDVRTRPDYVVFTPASLDGSSHDTGNEHFFVFGSPDGKPGAGLVIKDSIADITLQQVLTRPKNFDVIATLNLNGDYISDALAAQIGGIGIAPGGNINYVTGHAVFEATHGTAPKYANLDKVNPGSVILSGEMMLRYMGWVEAADAIISAMDKTIGQKTVTYDFARLMEGAKEVKCSEFGDALIRNL